jgi:hypothetical protein
MKINSKSIPLAYKLAQQVYDGKIKQSDAAKTLSADEVMNLHSATDYINNFKLMMAGRKFQRTLNYDSMDYFLDNIYKDYGISSLSKALLALNQHIEYYEGLQSVTMKKMRQLVAKYKQLVGIPYYIGNKEDLKSNIETLENYLTSNLPSQITDAHKLIKQGICFVAYKVDKEIRFAPSRYLGYANNEPYKYLLDIDGRETNKVISDILGALPTESTSLDKQYGDYCRKLGFEPPKTGSLGVTRKFWILELLFDFPANDESSDGFPEGRIVERMHKSRERNSKVVELAKQNFKHKHGMLYCEVCKFNFNTAYGEVGDDYIEGHHTVWVSDMPVDYKTKVEEIALLCANCHRMVHRKRPWLTIEKLSELLKQK